MVTGTQLPKTPCWDSLIILCSFLCLPVNVAIWIQPIYFFPSLGYHNSAYIIKYFCIKSSNSALGSIILLEHKSPDFSHYKAHMGFTCLNLLAVQTTCLCIAVCLYWDCNYACRKSACSSNFHSLMELQHWLCILKQWEQSQSALGIWGNKISLTITAIKDPVVGLLNHSILEILWNIKTL